MGMTMEWKVIQDFPNYSVSNTGAVKENKTGVIRKQYSQGHYLFVLVKNGQTKRRVQRYVHRLVAQAFHPCPTQGLEVNHIDGDKLNNNAENLEWVTRSQNQLHATRTLGKIRSHKGKPLIANWKPIGLFDKEGNLVTTFTSAGEASSALNKDYSHICSRARINGKLRGRYEGFRVRYL